MEIYIPESCLGYLERKKLQMQGKSSKVKGLFEK